MAASLISVAMKIVAGNQLNSIIGESNGVMAWR
jgi:hypothetical protein